MSLALERERRLYQLLWKLAPQHAIDRAVTGLLTPPPHRFPDDELRLMEDASLVTVPMVPNRLVGWRWGHRRDPLVILVHGWGGRGTQLKEFITPLLERGFSVIAFDAPGHGMTGGHESSLPHFLSALEALLDDVGPAHALVGHSLGGAVASLVMARRPEAVARGVIVAAPASLTDSTWRLAARLHWSQAMRAAVRRRIEYRFGVDWDAFEAGRQAGEQELLVIHDRRDSEVPFAEALRYTAAWPAARMFETEGLGHRRLLADARVVSAVAEFVATGAKP